MHKERMVDKIEDETCSRLSLKDVSITTGYNGNS